MRRKSAEQYLEKVDDGWGVHGVPVIRLAGVHQGLEVPAGVPSSHVAAEYLVQFI